MRITVPQAIAPAATFTGLAAQDAVRRYPGSTASDAYLRESVAWLERCQDLGHGGFSYGYSLRGGWKPPYRETTGYILTTCYRAAEALGRPDLAVRATRAAHWLLSTQNEDGSFANPAYGPGGIVFDTGQCLFGLVAAHERTGDESFRVAAQRAGQWLTDTLGTDPQWRRGEHLGHAHVYNTRTAWAMLRLNQIDPSETWVSTAARNLDWAVSRQQPSGFFADNAFVTGKAPYTHNISYAICGLQESGWLLGEQLWVDAARRCSDAVLPLQRENGFVPGQIAPDGEPTDWYSCLTGQSQLAIVWFKQAARDGDVRLADAARRSVDFVRSRVRVSQATADTIRGAVAGSSPVFGRYASMSYPNWATKFFVDALLLERSA